MMDTASSTPSQLVWKEKVKECKYSASEVMEALSSRREELGDFIEGPVEDYMLKLGTAGYGDELEIRVMKELYGVDFSIWVENEDLGATTAPEYPANAGAINLSYRGGIHYDAIVGEVSSNVTSDTGIIVEEAGIGCQQEEVEGKVKGIIRIIFWNSNG